MTTQTRQQAKLAQEQRQQEEERARRIRFIEECWKPSYNWTAKELREHIATGTDPLAVMDWKLQLEGWETEEWMRRYEEEFKQRCEAYAAERKAKREAGKIKKQRLSRAYQKEFRSRPSVF